MRRSVQPSAARARRHAVAAATLTPAWLASALGGCASPPQTDARPANATAPGAADPSPRTPSAPVPVAGGDAALPPADAVLTRIAFGSCAHQDKPQPIWDAILAARPELFVFAGDNVYGDAYGPQAAADDGSLPVLRAAYAKAAGIPGLARLRAQVPHVATWDDHDYGRNDGGAEFAHKRTAQRLFADFWRLPADDPRRRRDGVHHAWAFGPAGRRVQVVVLDTRFFRSALRPTDQRNAPGRERYLPDDDPAKTMLGTAQWDWLAQRLREPADLRLLVSSVQLLAEGHGWERWGNLPRERARMLALLRDTGARDTIVLSGDRHIGALYRETVPGLRRPLTEITSSGLTEAFSANREPGPNRLGDVVGERNFGMVAIDWTRRTAALTLRAADGRTLRATDVAFGAD